MSKWTHPIQNYWASKGTDVVYNALGGTDQLVDSYIDTFKDILGASSAKQSNEVKNICYRGLYPLENIERVKYTGFENVVEKDKKFRQKVTPLIKNLQFNQYVEQEPVSHKISYKASLLRRVKEFNDCYLYFSGGIDSELVAAAMLDAGVKFTPVIFKIIEGGTCKNIHDIQFAHKFCGKHGLQPITESIDIDEVWQDQQFQDMAVDLGIASPQIVTHSHFVGVIASKYPKKKHVFGGEVRFYIDDTGEKPANFVQLAKVDPVGYNGQTYFITRLSAGSCVQRLIYNTSGGWVVDFVGGSGDNDSGTWTTTPAVSYEYRVSVVNITGPTGSGSGGASASPAAPTTWQPITNGIIICSVTGTLGGSSGSWDLTAGFTVEVRKVGTTTPVVTGVVGMVVTVSNV